MGEALAYGIRLLRQGILCCGIEPVMVAETLLWRQGHGRLQFGLPALLARSFEGFAVPYLATSAGLSWRPRRCQKYGLRSPPRVLAQFAFGTRFAYETVSVPPFR